MQQIVRDNPVCVAPAGDKCGEGPVWHEGEQALYWTDINRFLIHRFNEQDQSVKSWMFNEPVTALALTDEDSTLAVALGSRVILWQPGSDSSADMGFHLPGWPAVRLNDGRADPLGNFWVGSMRNNVNADGSPGKDGGTDGVLYRIGPGGNVSEWKTSIGIANTVAWSPDQRCFYFGDSLANVVWAYEYDAVTGAIANERVFFEGFARGSPDGSAVDSEGYLWNCRYGGACIVRVAPDRQIERVIEVPAANVTSCTFGGSDYRTLYITTAGAGSPASDRLAGSLFAMQTDIPGQKENRVRLKPLG